MMSEPVRGPPAVGVIVTATTQVAPAASVAPQVVPAACRAKSPLATIETIGAAATWLLRMVTSRTGDASPTLPLPKSMLAGVTVSGAVPRPVTEIV